MDEVEQGAAEKQEAARKKRWKIFKLLALWIFMPFTAFMELTELLEDEVPVETTSDSKPQESSDSRKSTDHPE